jgi:predicted DNA-binding transcriptional regulator AlpA
LGVNPWTIDNWRKSGKIPQPIRLSSKIIGWRASTVRQWLNDREGQSAPDRKEGA